MLRKRLGVVAFIAVCLSMFGYGLASATTQSLVLGQDDAITCSGLAGLGWTATGSQTGTASCRQTYSAASGFPLEAYGTGQSTVSITPAHAGDLVVAFIELHSGTTPTVSGMSASNINWAQTSVSVSGGTAVNVINDDSSVPLHVEMWDGYATSTSTATTTLTYSGDVSSNQIEIMVASFHASDLGSGSWYTTVSGGAYTNNNDNATTTTVTFPSATTDGHAGIYVGYSRLGSSYSSCNANFTCWDDAQGNPVIYGTSQGAGITQSVTATQTSNASFISTGYTFYAAKS